MDPQTRELIEQIPPAAWLCGIIGFLLLWSAFWSIFCILFQRNLAAIPEPHRRIAVWQIWLLVIFPFSIFWMFLVLPRLSASWQAWLSARGDPSPGRCGHLVGLWCAILSLVSNLLGLQPLFGGGAALTIIAQILSGLAGLAGFILLIAFCIILNDLRHKAAALPAANTEIK